MPHRKGVQFGSFTTFPIPCHGLADPNNVPRFVPRHRTCFPTQSILRKVKVKLHETPAFGSSLAIYALSDPYPRPVSTVPSMYQPWSESHHRRASHSRTRPTHRRAAFSFGKLKLNDNGEAWIDPQGGWQPSPGRWSGPRKQDANVPVGTLDDEWKWDPSEKRWSNPRGQWHNTRNGWQWQWYQNHEPTTQATPQPAPAEPSPLPTMATRLSHRKRASLDLKPSHTSSSAECSKVTPHKSKSSSKERPKSDSFDLRRLAASLPQDLSLYHLHVDLTTVQPLLWSMLDVPSQKTVSLLSSISSGVISKLNVPACPGATEIVVHSHPRFSKIHFKYSPTIQGLLEGIRGYFYANISKKAMKMMTVDDRNTVFAAKSKRMFMRGPEEIEDDLRIDLLDGFVVFNGMKVLSHDKNGKVEVALELRREKRWDWNITCKR
ncbi:uncharacterized protein BT62DRAFT_60693 [Guyanagaster necrorhizus]|uniref:Uncharacterized protein n=1 Tax=Guyanagaster necrorhizus TaxID=856835 RepID=A0A9P7VUG8_9AGAR|nr:uncharacterized protein BT62DRAFT_60693 [Guyanagaster necrorhizus MCA 3950]KAG7447092.1 hypothetical protein BT62DRAFT_60693 [Guyanagaster necrorhizus MCA 3950]